jgi:hypothetical protein
MSIADLLNQAKQEPNITGLAPDAARGAEAYFQAYEYIAHGGQARTSWGRRRLSMRYLGLTASPPLTTTQLDAAQLAMAVVKHLS